MAHTCTATCTVYLQNKFLPNTPHCQILCCIPYKVCKLCKLEITSTQYFLCVDLLPYILDSERIWLVHPAICPIKLGQWEKYFEDMSAHKKKKGKQVSSPPISHLHVPRATQQYYVTKKLIGTCKAVYSPAPQSLQLYVKACTILASHTGLFRGASIFSLPTNTCSTENNNTGFSKNACVGG